MIKRSNSHAAKRAEEFGDPIDYLSIVGKERGQGGASEGGIAMRTQLLN